MSRIIYHKINNNTNNIIDEDKIHLMIEQSNEGICIVQNGIIKFINKKVVDLTGYSKKHILGKNFNNFFCFNNNEKNIDVFKRTISDLNRTKRYEALIKRNNNINIEVEIYLNQITYKDKKSYLIFIHDITDRNIFKELLKISKQKYENLLNTSFDVIFLLDLKGNILEANSKAFDLFGYTEKEILSSKIFKFQSKKNKKKFKIVFKDVLKNGFISFNSDFMNKNKEIFSAEICLYIINLLGKNKIQCVFRDITDKKNVEVMLSESLHFIDDIFKGIKDRISIVDCNFNIIRVNPAMEGIYKEKMPLIGKKCFNVYHNRNNICPNCPSLHTIKTGENHSIIIRSPLEGTMKGWIELSSYPLTNTNGKVIGILEHIKDITTHIKVKEDLKKERARAKEFIDVAGVMLIAIDKNKKIILINKKGVEILGYEDDSEVIGKNFIDFFIPKKNKKEIEEVFYKLIHNEAKEYQFFESMIITKEGREKLIAWNNIVLYDENNNMHYILSSGEDITERKKNEIEREVLIKELEKKNTELEQFIYTTSHDLKSPLVTIRGFLSILGEDIKKKDTLNITDDISIIKNSTERMWELLNDLLKISQVGLVVKKFKKINVVNLVNEAIILNKSEIKKKNVKIKINPELPICVADRSRLLQLFQNLIDNAVKFMGDQKKPLIEIGFKKKNKNIIYYIKDNGIGIDPIYHKKIFNLFDKLDQNISGSGVGLTIVKRVVELHNGKIWVESNKNKKGSIFCFIINNHKTEQEKYAK